MPSLQPRKERRMNMFRTKQAPGAAVPAVRACRRLQDFGGRTRRRDPVVASRVRSLAPRVPVRRRVLAGARSRPRPARSARPVHGSPRGKVRVRRRDRSRRAQGSPQDHAERGLLVVRVRILRDRLAGPVLRRGERRVMTNPLPLPPHPAPQTRHGIGHRPFRDRSSCPDLFDRDQPVQRLGG
jgi:hypothetical protein